MKMKWIIAALTASCLITKAFAQSGADPRTQEAATTARMTVDFSQAVAVAPQGGILEGWTATAPHDSMIKPIVSGGEYARIFSHGAFRLAGERAINLGYRLVVRLDSFPEVHAVEPYQDWSKWEAWVLVQARYWGHRAIYDLWNEPNIMTHWKGTREQYFEAYQRAHQVLLKELGEAVQITGPSVTNTAGWNTDWMKPFLDYCLANKLKVPVINWHELDGDGLRADEILLNLQAV